jgi:hypothetical protein
MVLASRILLLLLRRKKTDDGRREIGETPRTDMIARGSFLFLLPLLFGTTAAGCTQNDDPEGAKQVFAKINEGQGFRSWQRAPGFPNRKPSFTAHADAVEIFVSKEISTAFAGPNQVSEWPIGSIIVKEGFAGDARSLVAVMEKRPDGWHFFEYNGSGDPLYSGKPKICVDCHDNRRTYSDFVYAFELPR